MYLTVYVKYVKWEKRPNFFSFFIVITLAATSFLNITYLNKEKTVSSK